jgi:hypothetical protein
MLVVVDGRRPVDQQKPNPLLDRLLAIDCATQRVQQSVTL